MEVIPGLHWIATLGANVYLSTEPEPMLIDTGMPGQADAILAYLAAQGLLAADVRQIILTHHDIDHIGSAAELRKLTGAKVYAHRLDAPCIAGRALRRPLSKRFSSLLWRRAGLEVDEVLEGGETIAGWQILHTPGHSVGSISLYRSPALIVGDLLRGGEALREMPALIMEDRRLARESIRRLVDLDFSILLCGHTPPTYDAGRKLRSLIASWG